VARKLYTTQRQRELLKSVGVPHEQGRTREEADRLIDQGIRAGKLPHDCREPRATKAQREYLEQLVGSVPPNLTKARATELIGEAVMRRDSSRPITERQWDFIESLGGIPHRRMSLFQASQFIEYLESREVLCPRCGSGFDHRSTRCDFCGGFVPRLEPVHPPAEIWGPDGPRPFRASPWRRLGGLLRRWCKRIWRI
jgi:hypothetical protein